MDERVSKLTGVSPRLEFLRIGPFLKSERSVALSLSGRVCFTKSDGNQNKIAQFAIEWAKLTLRITHGLQNSSPTYTSYFPFLLLQSDSHLFTIFSNQSAEDYHCPYPLIYQSYIWTRGCLSSQVCHRDWNF